MKKQKGFTLIELLVVIAIIGILSAVILASLNTAREKGEDAAIQGDLSSIQTEAALYYSDAGNNSYGAGYSRPGCPTSGSTFMFYTDSVIQAAILSANQDNGGNTNNGQTSAVDCSAGVSDPNDNTSNFVVEAGLPTPIPCGSGSCNAWCVDSSGNAEAVPNIASDQYQCGS
jgi:prepilin-type N-terminal cleavage/methylation domain-containing protein